jgi:hypothetical protein
MKSESFYKFIDIIANGVWWLFLFAGKALYFVLCTVVKVISAAWRELGKVPRCERFCEETAGFFRGMGKGLAIVFYIPWKLGKWFVERCEKSAFARRIFLFLVIILGFLYYWYGTPSWPYGAWYSYQSGKASWYGGKFYFRRTASGDWFLPGPFYTAAHKTLPLGTKVLVVNRKNGKRVVVRINDRGPFVAGRIIDLTYAAARSIGVYKPGTANVVLYTRKPRYKGTRKINVYPFF